MTSAIVSSQMNFDFERNQRLPGSVANVELSGLSDSLERQGKMQQNHLTLQQQQQLQLQLQLQQQEQQRQLTQVQQKLGSGMFLNGGLSSDASSWLNAGVPLPKLVPPLVANMPPQVEYQQVFQQQQQLCPTMPFALGRLGMGQPWQNAVQGSGVYLVGAADSFPSDQPGLASSLMVHPSQHFNTMLPRNNFGFMTTDAKNATLNSSDLSRSGLLAANYQQDGTVVQQPISMLNDQSVKPEGDVLGLGNGAQAAGLAPANKKKKRRTSTRDLSDINCGELPKRRKMSKSKNSSSKYRGVSWHKRDRRYMARVWIKGKLRCLGNFSVEANAAKAVDAMLVKAYVNIEGIELNFPEDYKDLLVKDKDKSNTQAISHLSDATETETVCQDQVQKEKREQQTASCDSIKEMPYHDDEQDEIKKQGDQRDELLREPSSAATTTCSIPEAEDSHPKSPKSN